MRRQHSHRSRRSGRIQEQEFAFVVTKAYFCCRNDPPDIHSVNKTCLNDARYPDPGRANLLALNTCSQTLRAGDGDAFARF